MYLMKFVWKQFRVFLLSLSKFYMYKRFTLQLSYITLFIFYRAFPSDYDPTLHHAHIEMMYRGLLIHLDDPSPDIQVWKLKQDKSFRSITFTEKLLYALYQYLEYNLEYCCYMYVMCTYSIGGTLCLAIAYCIIYVIFPANIVFLHFVKLYFSTWLEYISYTYMYYIHTCIHTAHMYVYVHAFRLRKEWCQFLKKALVWIPVCCTMRLRQSETSTELLSKTCYSILYT